jgi:hypothetical protein
VARRHGKLVRFVDPFAEVVHAEEFVLRSDDTLVDLRAAYRDRMRVTVEETATAIVSAHAAGTLAVER